MSNKLVKCKSCGKEISVEAKTCPHCGAPVNKKLGCLPIIGLGLTALVVILIIVGMISGGGKNDSSSAAAPSQTAFKINQTVKVGNFEWVITGVSVGSRFANDMAEVHADSDETILVFVSGRVTNRANEEDGTLTGNLFLVDDKGVKYGQKKGDEMVADPLSLDTFNPNVPKKFSTIFEIPKSAKGVKFQVTDFAAIGEETALVDLALGKK